MIMQIDWFMNYIIIYFFERSAFPNAISQEPDFSQKNPGNFPSRAFLSQSRHPGLADFLPVRSQSRKWNRYSRIWNFGKIQEKFPKFSTGREIFLLDTEICFIKEIGLRFDIPLIPSLLGRLTCIASLLIFL